MLLFFFSSRRRHTRWNCDWSSDVCSSDLALAVAAAAYPALFRQRCLTWGATAGEVGREMPGDDLLPAPDLISTRAISIAAPPHVIWPWLAQMGLGRGGAYSYDWINNLIGFQMHSASEILPEAQDLARAV